ncbi:hypothetical protein LZ32DRAFT_425099 [Colletotrichum eremochloae]|nr:hypothetical protein LZ32DRAFT_425099 [Colletotrichum eremochloae]
MAISWSPVFLQPILFSLWLVLFLALPPPPLSRSALTSACLLPVCLFRASHHWKTLKVLCCSAVRPPAPIYLSSFPQPGPEYLDKSPSVDLSTNPSNNHPRSNSQFPNSLSATAIGTSVPVSEASPCRRGTSKGQTPLLRLFLFGTPV